MQQPASHRWCPRCARVTLNAPLPMLVSDAQRLRQLTQQVHGVYHRYFCQECREVWEAVEVPWEVLEQLLEDRAEKDQLLHQLALLRLKACQQNTTEDSHEAQAA